MKKQRRAIEILPADKAYATYFPSYNKVYDGTYIKSWDEMVEKMDKPVLLNISAEDWQKIKETDKRTALELKFSAGAFDSGACPKAKDLKTGNIRPSHAEEVPRPDSYNMVVLDADGQGKKGIPEDFDKKLEEALKDYEYYAYATISSNETSKRRRIVVPLAKPATFDQREALVRYIAEKVDMASVDRASARNKQLMCLPVHTKGGDSYHYHHKGEHLDPEKWLPEGSESLLNWPRWEGEDNIQRRSNRDRKVWVEQGKWVPVPDKNRLHNAYNATYKMSDILPRYGYEPCGPGRWMRTGGALDGLKVTNDSILYSYYGNDRLTTGQDLDAFEVYIICEYGSLSEKENWAKAYADAGRDEKVKQTMLGAFDVVLPPEAESWSVMYDNTEEGIAQRCASFYPHKIRDGKWYTYKNGIYTRSKTSALITDALQMVRIASALSPEDETLRDMIGKRTVGANIVQIWESIAMQNIIPDDEWENKPWYLNFTDCTIDLKAWCEGKPFIREHNPDDLLTESTGYSWKEVENLNPEAMDEVIRGLETYIPDPDLRAYMQRALGRALTATAATEDRCFWLMGPDGGNGKTTMLYAIRGALGSYYYNIDGKYLYYSANDTSDPEGPSPKKAGMRDKRFVNFSEYNEVRTLDPEKYKSFCSAGILSGRRLNEDNINFRAKCCCYIDSNGMPGLLKRENAILRRTRVIPFYQRLDGDGSVKDRWSTDREIHTAMLAWLMLGLKDWYSRGCKVDGKLDEDATIPADVVVETKNWINSFEDPRDFFEDYYIVTHDKKDYLIPEDCYSAYLSQVYDKGATQHAFRQAEARWLREHGINEKAKRQVQSDGLRRMCYIGVRLYTERDNRVKRPYSPIKLAKEPEQEYTKPKVEEVSVFTEEDLTATL